MVAGIHYSSKVAVSKPRDETGTEPDAEPDKGAVEGAGREVTDDGGNTPHDNRVRIQTHFFSLLCPLRTL